MNNLKKNIIYVFIIFGLYCFLFNPYFIRISNIGAAKIVYPFILLLFSNVYGKYSKLVLPFVKIFVLIIIYAVIIELLHGMSFINLYAQVLNLFELILVPFSISVYLAHNNFNIYKLLYSCVAVAIAISVFCFVNPSFNTIITSIQPVIDLNAYSIIHFRYFGLSSELAYGYALALGLIGGFAWRDLEISKWFIVFLILVSFVILINARTGFLAMIVSLISYLVYSKNYKVFFRIILSLIAVFFAIKVVGFEWINEKTGDFIMEFFNQIRDLLTGSNLAQDNYVDFYRTEMLILPDNLFNWIFGRGVSLYGASNLFATSIGHSDIGWIIQLNYGGLIFILLWLFLFIKLVKFAPSKWIVVYFLICALFFNIKGPFFSANAGLKVMTLISFYFYVNSYKRKNVEFINHSISRQCIQ